MSISSILKLNFGLLLIGLLFSSSFLHGQSVYSVRMGTYIAKLPGDRQEVKSGTFLWGIGFGGYIPLKSDWQLRMFYDANYSYNLYYPQTLTATSTESFYMTGDEKMIQIIGNIGVQRIFGKSKLHSVYFDLGFNWQQFSLHYNGLSTQYDSSGNQYTPFTSAGSSRNFGMMGTLGYNYEMKKSEKFSVQFFAEASAFVPFSDRRKYRWTEEVSGLYAPHQSTYNAIVAASSYAGISYNLAIGVRALIY